MYNLHVVLVTRIAIDGDGTHDYFAFIGYHSLSADFDHVSALPHVAALHKSDNARVDDFAFDSLDDLMSFVRGASRNSGLSLLTVLSDATRAANGDFVWRALIG
jgi:hypothetical protein